MTLTASDQWQAEQSQVDHDHHVPTAGAMTGHVLANLTIHSQKLRQLVGSVKGLESRTLSMLFLEQEQAEHDWVNRISRVMSDMGEAIPTTTAEFQCYTMLEEDGALKFESTANQLSVVVNDLVTQTLFVTRAIKLAEREGQSCLELTLKELDGWLRHQIRVYQQIRGQSVKEAMDEDDED
ncbi:hypothetical protein [Levilactobacillus bambusae]|uniref:DNA-binding protein n=1 Tax=Levilactobacillus bambusae TaxID=2024736 RepID=A0A2V1N0S4_9LACO|nr:hypothetical protein [Levilactobacillus bambusae]PWG00881.1 hypothetical protein DCM90_01530 [Levilactobacillus bambusae]